MTTQEENELLCEKLLGWERFPVSDERPADLPWKRPFVFGSLSSHIAERTPSFNTWYDAGLLLDALARQSSSHPRAFPFAAAVGFDPGRNDWSAGAGSKSAEASTGPLAIRAAALEYVGSLKP